MSERVTVLGDGGWGTALAIVLSDHGCDVELWSHDAGYAAEMEESRRNPRFLPGVEIPPAISVGSDLAAAVGDCEILFSVIPTQFLAAVHEKVKPHYAGQAIVSATKGIDTESLLRPTEIIKQTLGQDAPTVVVSGPSHAEEVSRRMPTTVVAGSKDMGLARRVQDLLATDRFRVYTHNDAIGVELGGALKNVISIAGGIVDGLGFGDNTKAALLTRGIVEMSRLGEALGGQRVTFFGLSGIGDLITSCTSEHGRNRLVGWRLGRGERLDDILASMQQVAEGVRTSKAVMRLSEKTGVEMPICAEVHAILFEGKDPGSAVRDLMTRHLKDEVEW
ncbi:MAG: NAD(P)H-dependent glycerol-3-phosphate dehydrogenase [Planctomycetota bacterium JB042]